MHFPSMFAVIEALISHPKRMSYVIGCEVISKVASKSFQSVTMTIGLFFFPPNCFSANSLPCPCPFSEISFYEISLAFQKR